MHHRCLMHKLCRNRSNKQQNSWFLLSFRFVCFRFTSFAAFTLTACTKLYRTTLVLYIGEWFLSTIKKFSHISWCVCSKYQLGTQSVFFFFIEWKWLFEDNIPLSVLYGVRAQPTKQTHKLIYYTCNELNE